VVGGLDTDKHNCIFVDDRSGPILQATKFGLGAIIFPSHAQYGARYLRFLLKQMRAA
jgi:hypothetical protein